MGELRETINELFNLQGNKLFRTIKGLTVDPGGFVKKTICCYAIAVF